jgi:hypothetical protein
MFPATAGTAEIGLVTKPYEPAYWPICPIDPEAYDQLYAFNQGVDDFIDNDAPWQEIRIRQGLAEDAVYRLLPSADAFEYGGYLTNTRIRFMRCHPSRAWMPMSKACTFHSHPTDSTTADCPSATDIFQFLNFRHLRAITVGSTRLWIWDKTKATLSKVKMLATWTEANMLIVVHRLEKTYPHAWEEPYAKLVLKHLGLNWPRKRKDRVFQWEEMLRKILKIKVRIFPRMVTVKRR